MAIKGLERLALFVGRKYRLVFIGCIVLLVLAIGSALQLRFDTDVLGLLPQHDPAVETLRETLDDFGSLDFLLIVLRIPDGAAVDPYESFVDVMGPRLQALEHFDQVDYKIGEIEELLEEEARREGRPHLGQMSHSGQWQLRRGAVDDALLWVLGELIGSAEACGQQLIVRRRQPQFDQESPDARVQCTAFWCCLLAAAAGVLLLDVLHCALPERPVLLLGEGLGRGLARG